MNRVRVGVISDTHGKLRRELFDLFAGVDHILHAGDLGPLDLLAELEAIAPVTGVWGNTDAAEVRARLPATASVELAGLSVVVTHGHQLGSPTPKGLRDAFPEAGVVVFGHTHRATIERIDGAMFLNPGSAGAPRFGLSASVAIVTIDDGVANASIVGL